MKVLSFDIGTRTLSYCILEVVEGVLSPPAAWESIDVHAEAHLAEKTKPTMREDSEYVVEALHRRAARFWACECECVIIEQQPAGGNNRFSSVRMKSISHVVHAYFYTMQLEQRGMGAGGCRVPITFVSPSSKLAGMDKGETAEQAAARQDGDRTAMGVKYRRNKKHAVDTTAALLAALPPSPESETCRAVFAAAAPKQDDLSDCFMLAYAFVTKKQPSRKRAPRVAAAPPRKRAAKALAAETE